MLASIRKFSSSIYAKILLVIIIIPFVFWGMGSGLSSGNKNVVVVIDDEKFSTQQFADFINKNANDKVEPNDVERYLSIFIGEKLIEKEVEYFGIKLSDRSLGKLLKHQKEFKRGNEFSRLEYEKFLLENNITAITFEDIISRQERKKQFLDLIGGGVMPSKFLVNKFYNNINQKRIIDLINLNDIFKNQLNFSEDQLKIYFENNKDKYKETFKTIKLIELNPKKLVNNDEFSDLFFKKIDEIDDLIISGKNLNFVQQKYNLEDIKSLEINEQGQNRNKKINKSLSKNLINKIFDINNQEPTHLVEDESKYFVLELVGTENIQNNLNDNSVKQDVELNLSKKTKNIFTSEIIDKINKKNFIRSDFDKISKEKNVPIQKINLNDQSDDKILKREVVNQIYMFPEKKIFVINDIGLTENYLIYVDKVENVRIEQSSDEYQKYVNLSKIKIVNELYNSYDNFIKKKYNIDINYQALDTIKNYFN